MKGFIYILKKNFLLLFLLLCSSIYANSIYEYLSKADQLYNSKDYKQALIQYKSAIDINPNSSKAHLGFAKTSLVLGYLGDAKTSFEKVLQLTPKNKEAIAGLAEVLSLQGKHKEGLELIENALKEEPYSPVLILEQPKIYLRMGSKEIALNRLEDAGTKIEPSLDYKVLLIQAYIANQKFQNAIQVVNELISKNPDNPESFYVKATLNHALAETEKDFEKVKEYMQEAKEHLLTSIHLSPKYEDGKKLLIKNYIWLKNYDAALKLCNELLEEDPENIEIIYLKNYLSIKLGNFQNAARDLSNLLKLKETDPITRMAAEEFAIHYLNERHSLRSNLGKYQLDEYLKFKDDYNYKSAEFHLERAHKLIPENSKLRKELLDYYYYTGQRKKLMKLLLRLREDDPDDIKINNRIENTLKRLRESLAYKEGFLDNEANIEEGIRTTPEIFIFDLKPDVFFPKYPDISQTITEAIKFSLRLHSKVKLISKEEEDKIRTELQKSFHQVNYTDAIYYTSENLLKLSEFRKRYNPIRYIGYGEILGSNGVITVMFQIYDRITGRILKNFRISTFGKNQLADLGIRVAEEIANSIPYEGKVIKVKTNTVIVNFGFRDGLKKEDEVSIFHENTRFKGIVKESDEFIAEVEIQDKNWKPLVGTEFKALKVEKKK